MEVIWGTLCLLLWVGEEAGEERMRSKENQLLARSSEITVGREGSIQVFLLVFSWSRKYITRKHLMLGYAVLGHLRDSTLSWHFFGLYLLVVQGCMLLRSRRYSENPLPCYSSSPLLLSYLLETSHVCLLLYVQGFPLYRARRVDGATSPWQNWKPVCFTIFLWE